MVFCDLVDSSAIAERLDPEDMRALLKVYLDAMRAVVENEGGVVEKFIGDAVVAVFGVPVSHEDDPARAIRAGRGMLAALEPLNATFADRLDVALALRIGINTGGVLASVDASPGEAIVTGDVVNVAARLQTQAAPGEILVAERTTRASRGFDFADRGVLTLKGFSEPVHAFVVVGGTGSSERGLPGLHAPMVGRDGELNVLMSVAERVSRERRPSLVTVFGEAGVGKSRLIREFLARAAGMDPQPWVLRGRCLPYGDGVTYWPLAEILKEEAGVVDSDVPAVALARIRATVSTLADGMSTDELDRTIAAMAYTVGLDDPSLPLRDTDPRIVRRYVHAAWRRYFSALSQVRPLVVVVEDIHWADAALLDLLDELVEKTEGPALYVCPSRPDLVASRPGWGGGRRNSLSVSLDPLGPDDSEQLVRLLLSVDDLPASVHRKILERAEGNPFFLEEILRRLIDEEFVVREGERWRAREGIDAVFIPDTVQGVLSARIDLLDAADKHVLQAAAVIGRVFWADLVTKLLAETASAGSTAPTAIDDVEDVLVRLENRDLVQRRRAGTAMGDEEHAFSHILTRDVAYESIPRRDRAQMHATVASLLEVQLGERSAELAELLAYHYATAVSIGVSGDAEDRERLTDRAYFWLMRASSDALGKYVLNKAMRFAQDALDLARTDVERLESTVALARAYSADSRGDLAWRHFREAALLADATPGVSGAVAADLMANAAEFPLRWPGSMSTVPPAHEVRSLIDRGLELMPEGDLRPRARLLAVRASWPFTFPEDFTDDELDAFRSAGLEAADIALRLGDANLASGALDQATGADSFRGHFRPIVDLWQRRYALRDRLTDDLEIGDLYAMGAWIHWEVAEYHKAIEFADSIAHSQEMAGAVHARAWKVAALFRLGRWDEALLPFYELRERLDDRRDNPPYYATHAYGVAALIHRLRGQSLEADQISAVVRATPETSVRIFPWRNFLRLSEGGFADASRSLANPPTSWEVHASAAWEARCDLALTGEQIGQEPAIVVSQALEYADVAGTPSVAGFAFRLAGLEAHVAGDLVAADRDLRRATGAFNSIGVTWEKARTELLLAKNLRSQGDDESADAVEASANATLAELRVVDDPVMRAALAR